MREIIIMVVIVIIILGGGFYTQNFLKTTTEEMAGKLEDLKQKVQQTDNIRELSGEYDEIQSRWQELSEKWSILVLHEEIDNTQGYLLGIKSAIECNDKDEALEKIEVSIFLMRHINEREEFSLINFF